MRTYSHLSSPMAIQSKNNQMYVLYVCKYASVCIYVYMHLHTHTHTHTHTQHTRTYIHTQVYHIILLTHVSSHQDLLNVYSTYDFMQVHIYAYSFVHIYTNTHVHTYIHTYTRTISSYSPRAAHTKIYKTPKFDYIPAKRMYTHVSMSYVFPSMHMCMCMHLQNIRTRFHACQTVRYV